MEHAETITQGQAQACGFCLCCGKILPAGSTPGRKFFNRTHKSRWKHSRNPAYLARRAERRHAKRSAATSSDPAPFAS